MIIYTCITNNYIPLHCDLPEGAEYIVYGVENPPAPWVGRPIEMMDCPIRSSRIPKILCPFKEPSVYIDAAKLHTINDNFIMVSKEIISNQGMSIMQHPHIHTYLEECAEYINRGLCTEEEVISITQKAKESGYKFSEFHSPLCTVLWRKGNEQDLNESWWKWYMRGGKRDQLAFAIALHETKTDIKYLPCRETINRWSDANPIDGVWWKNKGGKYGGELKDPNDTVDKLVEITKLNKRMRYRAAILTEPGLDLIWLFGDRSEDFRKNYPHLHMVHGLYQRWR